MRCIAAKTTIPVPKIYHYGTAAENPTGLGPFIIMEYIDHERTMSDALKDPNLDPDEYHLLDPNISQEKLEFLYRQMANILLQLSTLKFPRIGSLVEDGEGHFSVSGRPLIQNMNSLMEFTDMTPALLPSQPYSTSKEWYSALADMHLAQLTFQHNDAVRDEDEARDKYVARQLFRQLASDGRLTSQFKSNEEDHNTTPSSLIYCSDLRPSNVLIDKDLRIVGVLDWEFAYAAPAQFSYDPPWWLLLRLPECHPGGYVQWMEAYKPRLDTFIRLLEEEEKKMHAISDINNSLGGLTLGDQTVTAIATATATATLPLSQRMRESWERKTWIINYAARNSWEFDWVYWRFIDPMFFGPNEDADHHARLDSLTREQAEAMEPFVKMKMEESKERVLVQWDDEDAAAHLAKLMI